MRVNGTSFLPPASLPISPGMPDVPVLAVLLIVRARDPRLHADVARAPLGHAAPGVRVRVVRADDIERVPDRQGRLQRRAQARVKIRDEGVAACDMDVLIRPSMGSSESVADRLEAGGHERERTLVSRWRSGSENPRRTCSTISARPAWSSPAMCGCQMTSGTRVRSTLTCSCELCSALSGWYVSSGSSGAIPRTKAFRS